MGDHLSPLFVVSFSFYSRWIGFGIHKGRRAFLENYNFISIDLGFIMIDIDWGGHDE